MSLENPWHGTFDALCEELQDVWDEGDIMESGHTRDETLYDPVFTAEVGGRTFQLDLSWNATPGLFARRERGGGPVRFLRFSIFASPMTILHLGILPTDGSPVRRDDPLNVSPDGKYRIRSFDAVANALVDSERFWDLVRRLEPFSLLRIDLDGFFCGRRIVDAGDFERDRIRKTVEALLELHDLVMEDRPIRSGKRA